MKPGRCPAALVDHGDRTAPLPERLQGAAQLFHELLAGAVAAPGAGVVEGWFGTFIDGIVAGPLQNGVWWVEDLGSSNGTLVNGRRVTKFELQDGDTIQVRPGAYVEAVVIEDDINLWFPPRLWP